MHRIVRWRIRHSSRRLEGLRTVTKRLARLLSRLERHLGLLTDQHGNPVLANQQAQNLANSKTSIENRYREVTPEQAQQIANKGGLVVVAYDPKGSRPYGDCAY